MSGGTAPRAWAPGAMSWCRNLTKVPCASSTPTPVCADTPQRPPPYHPPMPARLTLDALRRYAIARSLLKPTTLMRALSRLGFVQMDPLRAPARAQDLALRHRVRDYRAGGLEARYPRLGLEEDFF